MQYYELIRTEVTEVAYKLRIYAENAEAAEIKASVGGIGHVKQKEGVEVLSEDELERTVLSEVTPCVPSESEALPTFLSDTFYLALPPHKKRALADFAQKLME